MQTNIYTCLKKRLFTPHVGIFTYFILTVCNISAIWIYDIKDTKYSNPSLLHIYSCHIKKFREYNWTYIKATISGYNVDCTYPAKRCDTCGFIEEITDEF